MHLPGDFHGFDWDAPWYRDPFWRFFVIAMLVAVLLGLALRWG